MLGRSVDTTFIRTFRNLRGAAVATNSYRSRTSSFSSCSLNSMFNNKVRGIPQPISSKGVRNLGLNYPRSSILPHFVCLLLIVTISGCDVFNNYNNIVSTVRV